MKRCASHGRFVAAGCIAVFGTAAIAANLTVTVDNIEENKGVLGVAVYEKTNWLDDDKANVTAGEIYDLTERAGAEPVALNFDLEPGEYGVVATRAKRHRVLDKNSSEFPQEPYAVRAASTSFARPAFETAVRAGKDGAAIAL